jgi:hypothetical protein
VGLVIAAVALSTTGCVEAPQVAGPGGGSSIAASSSVSTCPGTFSNESQPGFNTEPGPSLVDPATTEVLVCRYVSAVANSQQVWQRDGQGVLSGQRATALVVEVNNAPAANLAARGCPMSEQVEWWFFATGTRVTAQLWVQLNGCRFASDGTHTVAWENDDPLPS